MALKRKRRKGFLSVSRRVTSDKDHAAPPSLPRRSEAFTAQHIAQMQMPFTDTDKRHTRDVLAGRAPPPVSEDLHAGSIQGGRISV